MVGKIIDGKKLANAILENLKVEISKSKKTPTFAVIKVGENPASEIYIKHKFKVAKRIGIEGKRFDFPAESAEKEITGLIEKLNNDKKIDGILVQLPLPKHINEKNILLSVNPKKDIDCLHPLNVGNLIIGNSAVLP
ncbi:MAG: tetrahydrofolate dehydrogenase/cyclohydrolase catalytic domain-containing protein, partial [Alphaproteobacteria bacterium]